MLDMVVSRATEKLKEIGFKKKAGNVYIFEPAKDFLGWLGLNHASREGVVEINPVVGVKSQELENLLPGMLLEKPHPYLTPTISISLGYLMPEGCYRAWFFKNEIDLPQVADLVEAVGLYGAPFINSSLTIEALEQYLKSPKYAHTEHSMYRLPLARFLLRDKENALNLCQQYLSGLGNRTDLAANRYRRYEKAFMELLK